MVSDLSFIDTNYTFIVLLVYCKPSQSPVIQIMPTGALISFEVFNGISHCGKEGLKVQVLWPYEKGYACAMDGEGRKSAIFVLCSFNGLPPSLLA